MDYDGVGYDANCGNISSAVAPFTIDEGLDIRFSTLGLVRTARRLMSGRMYIPCTEWTNPYSEKALHGPNDALLTDHE